MVALSEFLKYLFIESILLFLWIKFLSTQLTRDKPEKKRNETKLRGENYPFDEGTEVVYNEDWKYWR